VPEKAKHYGISTLLPEPVDPASDLVLQYELKLTNGLSCGGAYLKFLTAEESFTPAELKDDTPYTVMFGPDKCGSTNKVRNMRKLPTNIAGDQFPLLQRQRRQCRQLQALVLPTLTLCPPACRCT
jgi:hypothetical protein